MLLRVSVRTLLSSAAFLFGALACASLGAADAESVLLRGATVWTAPDAPPISSGSVLVHGDRIVAVGKDAEAQSSAGAKVIDCSGETIVAGFWNCHIHLTEPQWADAQHRPAAELNEAFTRMLTRYGFTTVLDAASLVDNTVALRPRVESGNVKGPRILTAGLPLYPHAGIPYYVTESLPAEVVSQLPAPATVQEAVETIRKNCEAGADLVKLFLVTGVRREGRIELVSMDPEIARAAVAEAHRLGRRVIVHPSTVKGLELTLSSGADFLGHTIEDPENWTPEIVRRLRAARVGLIPTLSLFSRGSDFPQVEKEVKSYLDAGGDVLFGTDVGFLTDYAFVSHEFGYMADAGMTPQQILASLTTTPARRLDPASKVGRVLPGYAADLVVLRGDLERDGAAAFTRVRLTIRNGRVIFDSSESGTAITGASQ